MSTFDKSTIWDFLDKKTFIKLKHKKELYKLVLTVSYTYKWSKPN